jgi:hypothetical protein
MTAGKDATKDYMSQKYTDARPGLRQAQLDAQMYGGWVAVVARDRYEETRLRVQGFSAPKYDDRSDTGFLTQFEWRLPFGKIGILEYERRLKKLITPYH